MIRHQQYNYVFSSPKGLLYTKWKLLLMPQSTWFFLLHTSFKATYWVSDCIDSAQKGIDKVISKLRKSMQCPTRRQHSQSYAAYAVYSSGNTVSSL